MRQRAAHGSLPGLGVQRRASAVTQRTAVLAAVARRPAVALVAACLAVGLLSLLLPSTPTYDPWSWIIWGREILHGDLSTVSGPSWKPLPVLFTIPFSLTGDAAPDLWLAVARAGGLLAVALAFRVAYRLAPPPYGWLAGAVAAVGLVLSSYYVRTDRAGQLRGASAGRRAGRGGPPPGGAARAGVRAGRGGRAAASRDLALPGPLLPVPVVLGARRPAADGGAVGARGRAVVRAASCGGREP